MMDIAKLIRILGEKGLAQKDIADVVEAIQTLNTPPRAKSTHKFVPDTWHPSEKHHAKAVELGISDDAFTVLLASFREWEFKDGKSNFDLAFHRWLRTNAGRSHGTAVSRDFAADRAASRVQAMVEGARIAASAGRRRWTL